MAVNPSRLHSIRAPACLLLAVAASLVIVLKPMFDYDLYWHLAYGREMAQSGRIIDWDVFSHTQPGVHFDNRYWLAQWLFYRLWEACGGAGLVGLKLAVTALVAGLLYATARHLRAGPEAAAATTVLAVLAGLFRFVERPELFSLLFFALLGFLLVGYRAGRLRAAWLGLVPLIMLAWDWLHGAVYGFGLLAIHVGLENLLARLDPGAERPALRPLNLAFAATLLAMAINPWGLATYGVFFQQATGSRANLDVIQEYRAANWREFKPFFLMLAWGAFLTALRPRAAAPAPGAASLALGILGWRISRVTGVFALAGGPYIAGLLAPQAGEPAWKRRAAGASLALVALFLAGYIAWVKFIDTSTQSLGWQVDDQYLPAGAVRFVEAEGIDGRLFNTGDIGGYLAFTMTPQRRIFHYNHGQIFGDTSRYAGHPEEIQRLGITYAIVSDPAELQTLFPARDWARVYRDPGAVLVLRRLPQYAEVIGRHELRYFHPMLPGQKYRALALDPAARPRLLQETAVYLAFRRDARMAAELVQALGADPVLAASPEIAPYLRLAQRYHADIPGFAALAPGA